MDFQNQSASEGLLDDIIANVEGGLTEFANSDHFYSALKTSFGSDFNSEETAQPDLSQKSLPLKIPVIVLF